MTFRVSFCIFNIANTDKQSFEIKYIYIYTHTYIYIYSIYIPITIINIRYGSDQSKWKRKKNSFSNWIRAVCTDTVCMANSVRLPLVVMIGLESAI